MKVRELYSNSSTWCQDTFWRDAEGESCWEPSAAQWCMVSAIKKCYLDRERRRVVLDEVRKRLLEKHGWTSSISKWQDVAGRTFAEVRDVFIVLDR